MHHGPATFHLTEEKHATRTWDTGYGLRGMSNDSEWCDNDPFIECDVRWQTNWLIENMPFNQLSLNFFVGIIIMMRLTLHCYVCCCLGALFIFLFIIIGCCCFCCNIYCRSSHWWRIYIFPFPHWYGGKNRPVRQLSDWMLSIVEMWIIRESFNLKLATSNNNNKIIELSGCFFFSSNVNSIFRVLLFSIERRIR